MELHQCINFLLSTAQNTVFQYFNQKLSRYNMTPAQYGVLNCLWEHGALTPKQIGEFLVLEASSISGILERMQKNNLIERNIHPNNRRTIIVTTTEQADGVRHNIEEIVCEMNHKFLSSLSEDERHLFIQMLQKIIDTPK